VPHELIWEAAVTVLSAVSAAVVAAQIVMRRRVAMLADIAEHDALTGLLNGRASLQHAHRSLRCLVRERQLAIAMIDLDHFMAINDQFGPSAGNLLLQHFAEIMRRCVRRDEFVGRTGGAEFLAVMPYADAETDKLLIERLRATASATPFCFGEHELSLTCSAGVVHTETPDQSVDALMQRADQALYAAKNTGRDRVLVAAA
jgi:diguanylate cyclase (GGDEF)-like protein